MESKDDDHAYKDEGVGREKKKRKDKRIHKDRRGKRKGQMLIKH